MTIITGDGKTKTVKMNGMELQLEPSLRERFYSPDGFEWGYLGSGPAQLALAILMWYYPTWLAQEYHQAFKSEVISKLPRGKDWSLSDYEVVDWVVEKMTPEEEEALMKFYRTEK